MKNIISLSLIIIFFLSCGQNETFDLVVLNANILDVRSGEQNAGQTICIKDGIIKKIYSKTINPNSKQIIDAQGKLITPTFIDTHIHPISEFSDGDYDLVPDTIPSDSIDYYRENLTNGYLPDGTSTVLMMGHPDGWTDEFIRWSNDSQPNQIDLYTCGGALATDDGHTYEGHYRVLNPEVARQKIIEYHKRGIQHLKLYWRLKEPEFKSIQQTADSLGMKMFAHSGGFFDPSQLNVFQAMEMGIKHFEHIAILPCSIFDSKDWESIHESYQNNFSDLEGDPNQLSLIYILETFKHAEENKKDALLELIDTMTKEKCTISTTIGWVYKTYHDTFFAKARIDMSPVQFRRCQKNFNTMMSYLNEIHNKGIPIRIGSDTKPGGKIVLLEIMLMVEYGMSAEDALKIATINGAEAIGIDDKTGSIEVEKDANFIIWDGNPLDDGDDFVGGKTVVKGGNVFE